MRDPSRNNHRVRFYDIESPRERSEKAPGGNNKRRALSQRSECKRGLPEKKGKSIARASSNPAQEPPSWPTRGLQNLWEKCGKRHDQDRKRARRAGSLRVSIQLKHSGLPARKIKKKKGGETGGTRNDHAAKQR